MLNPFDGHSALPPADWRRNRVAPRMGSFRIRLLLSILVLSIIVAAAMTAISAATSYRLAQQEAREQLALMADTHAAAIGAWTDSLQNGLAALVSDSGAVLAPASPDDVADQAAVERLRRHLENDVARGTLFDALWLLDGEGTVVVSTAPADEGSSRRTYRYFEQGLQRPTVQAPVFETNAGAGDMVVVSAQPVRSAAGEVLGVLAGRAPVSRLQTCLQALGFNAAGVNVTLVGANHGLVAHTGGQETVPEVESEGATQAVELQLNGTASYDNHLGTPVVGAFRWVPALQVGLLVEQAQEDVEAAARATWPATVATGIGGIVLATLAAWALSANLGAPLEQLVVAAEKVAAGDLDQVSPDWGEDEIGVLARALNAVARRARGQSEGQETPAAGRAQESEQRASHYAAATQVALAASTILDADQLSNEVVELIRQHFGLCAVALFTLEESGQWANLRAEAGEPPVEQVQRFRIGDGMLGWCLADGQARVGQEKGGVDKERPTPAGLSGTWSEATIPLRSRGRVIGVLSVVRRRPEALEGNLLAALQSMADLVAVALDNALLFAEREQALQVQSKTFGELSRQQWLSLARSRPNWGYRYDREGVSPVQANWRPEMARAVQEGQPVTNREEAAVAIPLQVRDQVIGALEFKRGAKGEWAAGELDLLHEMSAQVGVALEAARLHQEAQQQAARERLTRELATRWRRSLNVRAVLRTAAAEIGRALDLVAVEIRLGLEPGEAKERQPAMVGQRRDAESGHSFAEPAGPAATSGGNGRLNAQGQPSTVAERQALAGLGRQAWRDLLRDDEGLVARYDPRQILPAGPEWPEAMRWAAQSCESTVRQDERNATLALPLCLHGQVIGALSAHRATGAGGWTRGETSQLESLGEQLVLALENARLYEETERKAALERMVSQFGEQIREAGDVEHILQTAVRALRRVTGASRATVRLGTPTLLRPPPERQVEGNE